MICFGNCMWTENHRRIAGGAAPPSCWRSRKFLGIGNRRQSEIFTTYLHKNALLLTNYEVLIAISNIMKEVINDEKNDMISKFYNLDAKILLSEANIFTALHAMQTRSSDENSVRPSVKRVHCNKTEERSVQIFIPYERTFSLVFWEEWFGGGNTFYLKFWVNRPRWSEIADFQPIFACSASAVTPSEKRYSYH